MTSVAHLLSRWMLLAVIIAPVFGIACSDGTKTSMQRAERDVAKLVLATQVDVEEIRKGLPQGLPYLLSVAKAKSLPRDDLQAVRDGLDLARAKVQDLRTAKSTFFAWAEVDGTILRTDRDPDLMAGRNLLTSYPALRGVLEGKPIETRGSMADAAGVRGRSDGQWVTALPILVDGKPVGLYATGWSWSAYAYRLENAARAIARDEAAWQREKEPLLYVYILVEKTVFGAPVSPMVNAEAIQNLSALGKAKGDKVYVDRLEITGRAFGLAVKRAPALGNEVAVALLRSET